VADSSLQYDRQVEFPFYARAGAVEAWLVDLVRGEVDAHREPGRDGFCRAETRGRGDRLEPLAFPDLSLFVDGQLG